jgi:serine/threonine-protein kinase
MYEMLTGLHPFDPPTKEMLLTMHVLEPVPPMSVRAPHVTIPEPVEAVVRRLLEKDPKARFQKARDLVQALEALMGEPAPLEPSIPSVEPATVSTRSQQSDVEVFAPTMMVEKRAAAPSLSVRARTLLTSGIERARAIRPVVHEKVGSLVAFSRRHGSRAWSSFNALPPKRRILLVWGLAGTVTVTLVLVLMTTSSARSPEAANMQLLEGGAAPAESEGVVAPAGTAAPAHASAEQIEGAAGDPAALEELDEHFPNDPAVLRELVLAYHDAGRIDDALRTIARRLALEPILDPKLLAVVVRGAAYGRGKTADDAFALLEGPMGAQGVDVLLELSHVKVIAIRQRATKSLTNPEIRAHASPQVAILFDMQEATTCEAKRDLLARVAEDGDIRLLPNLKSLKAKRGCGFLNVEDCWPCLHEDRALDEAIDAVSERGK